MRSDKKHIADDGTIAISDLPARLNCTMERLEKWFLDNDWMFTDDASSRAVPEQFENGNLIEKSGVVRVTSQGLKVLLERFVGRHAKHGSPDPSALLSDSSTANGEIPF